MRKFKCVIQLEHVPESVVEDTCGAIDEGMFLTPDAIKTLLNGNMFSPVDCMWGFAAKVCEKKALKVRKQLLEYNIIAHVVRLW